MDPAENFRRHSLRCGDVVFFLGCALFSLFTHPTGLLHWAGAREVPLAPGMERLRLTLAVVALCAGVVHLIIRVSPALLDVTGNLTEEEARGMQEPRLRRYSRWFVAMRWIAVLVAGMLVHLVADVHHSIPEQTRGPLWLGVGMIGLSNLGYMVWERRITGARSLVLCQLYLDLLFFTYLLHFSGGVENPLAIFMIFHVVIAGILLSRTHCYLIAGAGSALFAFVSFGEWSGLLPHYSLQLIPHSTTEELGMDFTFVATVSGVQTAALFLAAYFVTTLSQRLREGERQLAALADKAREEGALLGQALETTRTGLRVLSPELQPERCNARWSDWFGGGTGECKICVDMPDGVCPARSCLEQNGLHEVEVSLEAPDGKERTFQLVSAPLHDARGNVRQVVQLARDITDQKEADTRMMRAGQLAAVGELAGQVAHEVNNPIAILHGKCELLLQNRRQDMSDAVAGEIRKISEQSLRVAKIASGLLSYARPMPSVREPFDLRVAIRKALSFIEERAARQGIEVRDDLPPDPMPVHANAAEMEQVFLNLCLNAIQAMPGGGRLQIRGGAGEEHFCVALADNGPGIPGDLREKVFEPFFTTKPDGRGTGLGLSICQGLLRSHGGNIRVDASPEGGCLMTVCLPRLPSGSQDKKLKP